MQIRYEIFLIIIGCSFVTLLPRILPLILLGKFTFPVWYEQWLSFLPVTIMAALVAQQLIPTNGDWQSAMPHLIAGLISFVIAMLTKSLFITVMIGVLSMAVINMLF